MVLRGNFQRLRRKLVNRDRVQGAIILLFTNY